MIDFLTFRKFGLWRLASYLVAAATLLPLSSILISWLSPTNDAWDHVESTMLLRLLQNSGLLLIGALIGTSLIGLSLAWILSQYHFPGRNFFSKALLLPLAIPSYVMGFVYVGMFEYSGPVATFLRGISHQLTLPSVRSLPMLVIVMSLALYPYVMLIAKTAFESMGRNLWEASQSLGLSRLQSLPRLALPMAAPWVIGALSLVGMETLADFGTASVFVYDTFPTAIYKTWYGLFSPETASKLASFLLLPIGLLYVTEHWSKKKQAHRYESRQQSPNTRASLKGSKAFLVISYCSFICLWGFFLPLVQLIIWASKTDWLVAMASSFSQLSNSAFLAGAVGTIVVILSILLTYTQRFTQGVDMTVVSRVATLGYAIPGAVLAIGVFLPLARLDHFLADFLESLLSRPMPLLITGSVFAMLIGLSIRFLAVSQTAIFASQKRIAISLDEAATNLDCRGLEQLRRIHLPLLKKSMLTAWILVFIDVLKEMPLTLMTRPYGWDTLSVRVFEFISEGEWEKASVPSLMIVFLSMVAVIFLKSDRNSKRNLNT